MKCFRLIAFLFLVCVVSTAQSATDDEVSVREVANAFASTTLLGSDSNHYVTSVAILSEDTALVIIGENSGEEDDPNAYKVTLQKNQEQWEITSYEYIFEATGKKVIETMDPPFPAPYWDKLIKETG